MRIKSLLIIKIFLLIASVSFSQTSTSKPCPPGHTCIADSNLGKAAYLIDRGRKDSVKVQLLEQKVDTMSSIIFDQNSRLESKDRIIRLYGSLETTFGKLEGNYLKDLAKADSIIIMERKISKDLEKQLKSTKRKIMK